MIKDSLLHEFFEAVVEMRSVQKEYDKSFRGKAIKIICEERVDRILKQIDKERRENEAEKIKNFVQDLF